MQYLCCFFVGRVKLDSVYIGIWNSTSAVLGSISLGRLSTTPVADWLATVSAIVSFPGRSRPQWPLPQSPRGSGVPTVATNCWPLNLRETALDWFPVDCWLCGASGSVQRSRGHRRRTLTEHCNELNKLPDRLQISTCINIGYSRNRKDSADRPGKRWALADLIIGTASIPIENRNYRISLQWTCITEVTFYTGQRRDAYARAHVHTPFPYLANGCEDCV